MKVSDRLEAILKEVDKLSTNRLHKSYALTLDSCHDVHFSTAKNYFTQAMQLAEERGIWKKVKPATWERVERVKKIHSSPCPECGGQVTVSKGRVFCNNKGCIFEEGDLQDFERYLSEELPILTINLPPQKDAQEAADALRSLILIWQRYSEEQPLIKEGLSLAIIDLFHRGKALIGLPEFLSMIMYETEGSMNIIERLSKMAQEIASDYPCIESCEPWEQLYAIQSTYEGTVKANEDLHRIIYELCQRFGISPKELIEAPRSAKS